MRNLETQRYWFNENYFKPKSVIRKTALYMLDL